MEVVGALPHPLPVGGGVGPLDFGKGDHEVGALLVDRERVSADAAVPPGRLVEVSEEAVGAAAAEDRAVRLALRGGLPIEPAGRRVEADPVRQALPAVFPGLRLSLPLLQQQPRVLGADPRQRLRAGHLDPVLVLAERGRGRRVEAAEVEEAERLPVDEVASPRPRLEPAHRQVPVGDVVGGVAEDVGPRPDSRHEIDPALVDETPFVGFDQAVVLEPLRPPGEQLVGDLAVAERDEAEVVGAGDQDVLFGGLAAVAGEGRGEVGGEDDTVLAGQAGDLLDRVGDPDVGIEIGDGLDPVAIQEVAQEPGLDRGRELGHVVGSGHLLRIGKADLVDPDQLEGLLARLEIALELVDDQNRAAPVRVVGFERLSQDPGLRYIVLRDNGADVHD